MEYETERACPQLNWGFMQVMTRIITDYVQLHPKRAVFYLFLLPALCFGCLKNGWAQAPLHLINNETEVRRVQFRGNETFEDAQLETQLATQDPTFLDKLTFWRDESYPFNPVELQKDVSRLRAFYRKNGFLKTHVDYIAVLDSAQNQIRILFVIDEGPALMIQSLDFIGPSNRDAFYQFEGRNAELWRIFRRQNVFLRSGDRLSNFELLRIQDATLEWLGNRGYAFGTVRAETEIDTAYNVVDVRFLVDAGPYGTVSDFKVEGNESISDEVLLSDFPLKIGRRFSHKRLIRGQREIFALNLFRLVLVDVPLQPRDSTVSIRILVQEAPPRRIRALTGYTRDQGFNIENEATHRNFLGQARSVSLTGRWQTGFGATRGDNIVVGNQQQGELAFRQPHFLHSRLSGVFTLFADRQENVVRELEYGIKTTLIYKVHAFRPLSVEYVFSEARSFGQDVGFRKSVLGITGLFGKTDDYIAPKKGFLIQPFLAFSAGTIGSSLDYFKLGAEGRLYLPLSRRSRNTGLAIRLYAGLLHPLDDQSRNDIIQNERFDKIRFYAGGANDVRGWGTQALGPKVADVVQGDTVYVPQGGLSKVAGNVEFRLPFPGLGSRWKAGAFVDFGKLGTDKLRIGLGGGLRYETPFGFLRFDTALQLNPSLQDRVPAGTLLVNPNSNQTSLRRRLKFYLSIGQAF